MSFYGLIYEGNFVAVKLSIEMEHFIIFWKGAALVIGAWIGWIVGEFKPTFPLIIVAVIFIVCDAWTAYQLDKRVKKMYPDKTKRPAKFLSFKFGKVVTETIPKRLMVILLAFLVEHWVFIHVTMHLSYIACGVVCFEQFWSILENEASCRDAASSRFWKILQKITIDKTERHFDVNLDDLKEGEENDS